jgi:hypothetical protein
MTDLAENQALSPTLSGNSKYRFAMDTIGRYEYRYGQG